MGFFEGPAWFGGDLHLISLERGVGGADFDMRSKNRLIASAA